MSGYDRPFTAKQRAGRAETRQTANVRGITDIANTIYGQTQGLRSGTLDTLNQVLAGGRPENMRVFAPEIEAVNNQYQRARENILATSPARGGQLNRMLMDTDLARASTLGSLESDIRKQAFQQSLGLGWGTAPALTLGGLGQAANIYGQQVAGNEGSASGKNSSAGSLLGLAAAAALLA